MIEGGVGVYFDLQADQVCQSVNIHTPFAAYIVITRPSAAELHGFECRYRLVVPTGFESMVFRIEMLFPHGSIGNHDIYDVLDDELSVGWPAPVPGSGENIVL